MITLAKKADCCGCRSCEQSCPVHCITMKPDAEGFLYPNVDINTCIGCGACERACPIIANEQNMRAQPPAEIIAYGGRHKDDAVRGASSSGGAFSVLAEKIIEQGGTVFGCALNEHCQAVHIGVDRLDELALLRGSKYVQSDTKHSYTAVKELLEAGKKVLFVGTPCQAAGLYSFFGNKRNDNLYTVDFICHGVPSPMVFADYINKLEKENGSKVISFKFRNKDRGWNQTGLQLGTYFKCQNGAEVRKYPAFQDKYMNCFLDDTALRPSCYECRFKQTPKYYADLTIADFWGVNKVDPTLNDKKGTSLILVNTAEGKQLWDAISKDNRFEYKEVDFPKSIRKNQTLLKSAEYPPQREKFFVDYKKYGYDYAERKYMSAITWFSHKICKIIIKILRRFEQFIKFGIVGCSNTLINLFVYYLFLYLGAHYLIAYTFGFLVSVSNAFFWNSRFVFKNKHENNAIKAFLKVFLSYGFSFILSVGIMSLMVEVFRISAVIAPVLKLAITIPMNFLLNKYWAFKDHKK